METKLYRSRLALVKDLASRFEDIDASESMKMVALGFVTKDKVQHQCLNPLGFCNTINGLFGDVVCPKGTRTAGKGAYLITYTNEAPKELKEMLDETVEAPVEAVVEETSTEEKALEFDFDYANTLREGVSKKEAKDALELYAREFGIELNKTKTFDNMLLEVKGQ